MIGGILATSSTAFKFNAVEIKDEQVENTNNDEQIEENENYTINGKKRRLDFR